MTRCVWTLVLCLWASTAVAQPPDGNQPEGPGSAGTEQGGFGPGGPNDFGPGGPGGPGGRMSSPLFEAIDADGDGVLTKAELRHAVAVLKKLDADGDGNISLAEASPQRGPFGDPAQMVDRMMERDADGDGKLTADELPSFMSRIVQEADKNGDGALDRDELKAHMEERRNRRSGGGPGQFGGPGMGMDPQQMAQQTMMQNDRSRDNRLTVDEVPRRMIPMLRNADVNGDHAIDLQELQAAIQRMNERASRDPFGPGGPGAGGGGQDGPIGGQGLGPGNQ
jgi:hypothetical protein